LETTMSRPPQRAAAASIAAAISGSIELSAGRAKASPPAVATSSANASSGSRRRATRPTRAPSAARRNEVARPMPALAPVTTARRPANLPAWIVMKKLPSSRLSLERYGPPSPPIGRCREPYGRSGWTLYRQTVHKVRVVDRAIALFGTLQPVPERIELRAGPVSATLEDGALRWI